MASDYPEQALEEVADLSGGFAFKSGDYSPEGRFILRTLNINDDGSIHRKDAVFLPLEKCDPYKRFELQEHDTLFVMVGATLGKVGYVRGEVLPALLNQNMWRIRARDGLCDKRYLQYAFRHKVAERLGWASGSARDFVRRDDYRTMKIPVPPLREQERIAHILGTLDDKIELNRRMNATLEAMAQALFQSWFVDSSDERMKEVMLGNLITFARKAINPAGFPTEVFNHYSLPAFDVGRLPARDTGDSIKSNKTLVTSDAVLLSKLNPRIPRVWLPNIGKASRSIASTEFLVVQPNKNVSREFLFGLFTSPAFLQTLEGMVTGTSGSHQRVKPDAVLQIPVSLPQSSVMERYTDMAGPLLRKVQANIEESKSLATMRDTLLPKLLRGEATATAIS